MAYDSETLGAAIGICGVGGGDITALEGRVSTIEGKISSEASSTNKLADKAYVNDSINASSAFFRGSFATKAALLAVQWQTSDPTAANYVSNNDFSYVEADETHNDQVWRYAYKLEAGAQDNGWHAQYMINEGPFTQEQWAAIDSGITSEKVSKSEINALLLHENIPDTTQIITFDSLGNVSTIVHTNGSNVAVRTDAFTFGTSTITEVRTLNTGESLTIVTNTTTLTTTVTYAA